jgi:hypothetical protein
MRGFLERAEALAAEHGGSKPSSARHSTCCSRTSGREGPSSESSPAASPRSARTWWSSSPTTPAPPNSLSVKTIAEFLTSIGWTPPRTTEKLLGQPHCHHYSVMGYDPDRTLLEAMGCDVETSAGCCGLAGNSGMEKGHYEISAKIAQDGILGKASAAPDRRILADGFSSRTQVRDLADLDSRHLVQIIAEALQRSTATRRQPS